MKMNLQETDYDQFMSNEVCRCVWVCLFVWARKQLTQPQECPSTFDPTQPQKTKKQTNIFTTPPHTKQHNNNTNDRRT